LFGDSEFSGGGRQVGRWFPESSPESFYRNAESRSDSAQVWRGRRLTTGIQRLSSRKRITDNSGELDTNVIGERID
jgi:hypothetical protein